MRYITILLVVFILGSNCIGQKILKNYPIIEYDATKQDTIKVLMLVCDTSGKISFGKRIQITDSLWYKEKRWYEDVWWQFGYEVYEMRYGQIPCNSNTGTSAIAAVCYGWYRSKFISKLDQDKKPLPKSIIVWITKEIEP